MVDSTALSPVQIREYAMKAMDMEGGIYYFQQMQQNVQQKIQELQQRISQLSSNAQLPPKQPVEPRIEEFSPEKVSKKGWIIGAVATGLIIPVPIGIVLGLAVYFIGPKLFGREKEAKKYAEMNYTAAMNTYRVNKQNYPAKLEAYNKSCRDREQSKADAARAINELMVIKNDLAQKISDAELRREEFYSANIIHPKYQGLVPMSRFFEYFDTGMCDTLKEAMNTYETELRFEKIKGSIDQLTYAVGGVQEALFGLKNEINVGVNRISSLLGIVNGQLDTQNYYSQITAECNKQIAADVNTLKFLRQMEWIQDRGALPLS